MFYTLRDAKLSKDGPKFIYAVGVPCRYVVCTERKFWNQYMKNVPENQRNYYEVIEEDSPCHLYIDLDVNMMQYPSIDVYDVKDMVRRHVDFGLKNMGLEITEVIIADSSNDKKGSIHMIYKLKNYIWKNNANVGAFMRRCFERRVKQIDGDRELWRFVDMCVYSRNRLFRMLGCSKSNENRVKRIEGTPFDFKSWKNCKIQPMHTDDVEKIECSEPDGSPACYKSRTALMNDNEPSYMHDLKDFVTENVGNIRGVQYSPLFKTWSINLDKRDCVFKNERHGKNTNYIVVNVKEGTYHYRCWSQKYDCCKDGRSDPIRFPDKLYEQIQQWGTFTFCPSINTN